MKVLHLASDDTWGGAERALLLIVDGTRTQPGVDVSALLFNEGALGQALRDRGVPVSVFPERTASFLGLARALRRHLDAAEIEVVHAHRYKEILLAALVHPRRCRLVVTVHGLEPWRQAGLVATLRTWCCLAVARARGARFAAVSDELARRLASWFGSGRVARISNPISPRPPAEGAPDLRARCGWTAERSLVGFVGRLEWVKGPDRLLDVAKLGPSTAGFVLLGSGSLADALAQRVAEQGLAERVSLLGEIPDAAAVLPQLDALAMTSRHEGLPMVLLEAAAAGVPVVAYDVGGVREVLDGGPAARCVADGDAAGFAAALAEVLTDREASHARAAVWGASVAERFSAARTRAGYLSLYRGGS